MSWVGRKDTGESRGFKMSLGREHKREYLLSDFLSLVRFDLGLLPFAVLQRPVHKIGNVTLKALQESC